jgi:hypothetical protein
MYERETGLVPEAQSGHDQHSDQEHRRGLSPRASLTMRRLLALSIAVGIACGTFQVVFRADILGPVLAYAEPLKNGVDWLLEDPKRAWAALAVLVVPHIGMYYLLFEDRK